MQVRRHSRKHIAIISSIIVLLGVAAAVFLFFYMTEANKIAEQNRLLQIENEKAAQLALIEAKKKEPVYISLPNAKPIRAIVEDYTQTDSLWALVNKSRPISLGYTPKELVIPTVATRQDLSQQEQSVRKILVEPLKKLFAAAKDEQGYDLLIGSGYRSAELQKFYFDSSVESVGLEETTKYLARPGQSEHQTGLTVDLATVSRHCYVDTCFADTPEGKWLAKNAHRFGFTLRYPSDKTNITKYSYEPWHFRYVGVDLATALYDSGLTLDEAWPYLETALNTLKRNGAL